MKAYHWPSEANCHQLCIATKVLEAQVRIAKSHWACRLAYNYMEYCTDPIKAWRVMRTLEKGLSHHHSKCHTVCMRKSDGTKATTDEENAEVFCEHFSHIFNTQNLLSCDLTALNLIHPCNDFTHLATAPSLTEVTAALCCMANSKASGPSGITSDALKAMVWKEHQSENKSNNDNAEYLVSVIHAMILDFWTGHLDFQSWESATLVPVPKKGDSSNPNKWQPICLLEPTYK
eukprot:4970206-Ditylum_brightwellii.AAC.1